MTALGALTSYGRLLLDAADPADADPLGADRAPVRLADAVRALDALLPAPVDHVLVQADLSVVVPGPPEPELAAELDVIAEQESAGSVHRVTAASVRRALDVGYSAADLHALFKRRSRTPVPQALTYLIDDAARKHGGLRAGSAGGYLRSDDEALIAEVLADRRLSVLGLRRLAPTVLVSPYQVSRLLGALRDAGFAPVAEDARWRRRAGPAEGAARSHAYPHVCSAGRPGRAPAAGRAPAGRGGRADPAGRHRDPGGPAGAGHRPRGERPGRGRADLRCRRTARRWRCCSRRSGTRPGSGWGTWTRTARRCPGWSGRCR